MKPLPSFKELPLQDGDPPNSAWGLWGDGPDSALGSLNYLTDDLLLRTVKEEIKTGERVGLKYVSCKLKFFFEVVGYLRSMQSPVGSI